jgi:hypothetical protein
MTPDPRVERSLPDILADLYPRSAPAYRDDLLQRTARTRQRPAWTFPGRWFQMPAITGRSAIALVAVLAIAIIGGAVFLSQVSGLGVGKPSVPSVPATAAPSATPYASPQPMPGALVGGWLAPLRPVPGLEQGTLSVIRFGATNATSETPAYAVDLPGKEPTQRSRVMETAPGVIEISSLNALGQCASHDTGHYRWSVSADGGWLTLAKIDDTCAARAAIMPGSWVRSGAHDSAGGPVVQANFEPYFSFTLPRIGLVGGGLTPGLMTADTDSYTFKVWQDPDGAVDPCDATKGKLALAPGIDPFVRYMTSGSGFTVTGSRETTVDGHRAVALDFTTRADIKAPCWTNPPDTTPFVLQWAAHAEAGWWNLEIGGRDTVIVTEVDGHTLVFEVATFSGSDYQVDQAALDSIRFLDALPTPPAQ